MNVKYYVIALRAEHPLAQNNRFHSLGVELHKNALLQTGPQLMRMEKKEIQYAEMFAYSPYAPRYQRVRKEIEKEIEAKIAEGKKHGNGGIVIGGGTFHLRPEEQHIEPAIVEEYGEYAQVYLLNELALQMYSEGNVKLEVLKTITLEEVPEIWGRCFRGPYLPKHERESTPSV